MVYGELGVIKNDCWIVTIKGRDKLKAEDELARKYFKPLRDLEEIQK